MSLVEITRDSGGSILVLTLNRPEKLNAFNSAMRQELCTALASADEDDSVRAVVITGAGSTFCAGADISDGADVFSKLSGAQDDERRTPVSPEIQPDTVTLLTSIFNLNKPVLAAVNGPAIGIGATLTLPADVRICSDSARFGFVFTRLGLVPELASSWFLPKIVGISRALQWCLPGRTIDAKEALSSGLVSKVVSKEDLLEATIATAQQLVADTSPVAVALTRQLLWRASAAATPYEAIAIDNSLTQEITAQGDVKEGIRAFFEKRSPRFPNSVSQDMPPSYPWWTKTRDLN